MQSEKNSEESYDESSSTTDQSYWCIEYFQLKDEFSFMMRQELESNHAFSENHQKFDENKGKFGKFSYKFGFETIV